MKVTPINQECVPVTGFQPPIEVEFCEQMNGVSFVTKEWPDNGKMFRKILDSREMMIYEIEICTLNDFDC